MSRPVEDFAALLERAQRNGWRLVLLDLGVETRTPAWEFVSNNPSGAQYERKIISGRTRKGLAAKPARASGSAARRTWRRT